MRLVMVIVLVPLPSLLDSLSASFRWSAPSPSRSKLEVDDDGWGRVVSDSAFKMDFLIVRFE